MTDCQPAFVPALEFGDWEKQEREHTNRADEFLPTNKTTLFDALAAANITIVVVTFDGYGDSGQIENIEVKSGDEIATLPAGAIELARPIWGSSEIALRTCGTDSTSPPVRTWPTVARISGLKSIT